VLSLKAQHFTDQSLQHCADHTLTSREPTSGLAPHSYAGRRFWTASEETKGTKTSVRDSRKNAMNLVDLDVFWSFSNAGANIFVGCWWNEQPYNNCLCQRSNLFMCPAPLLPSMPDFSHNR